MKRQDYTLVMKQDVWGIVICLLFLFHRAVAIDYSSFWQLGVLSVLYVAVRIISENYSKHLLYIFSLWGVAEGIVAVLQQVAILESNHRTFAVTGTFGNPGPLGGFLAICLMVTAGLFYNSLQKKQAFLILWNAIAVIILSCGLFLSASRAGWLAVFIGSLFLFINQFKQCSLYKKRGVLVNLAIVFLVCFFILGIYLLRKDSADGRLLIWMNSLNMIKENPLFGIGAGGGVANYMHYQADYFHRYPNSSFILLADNVAYPFNEFLHIMVDQGIMGLLFLLLLLHSLFSFTNDRLLKAALLSFGVFSFFSYPAGVFVLQIVFIFLLGMLQSQSVKIRIPKKVSCLLGGLALLGVGVMSTHSYCIYCQSKMEIKKLAEAEVRTIPNAELKTLYPFFCCNPRMMNLYSQICIRKYPADIALPICEAAAKIVPTCELYCDMGDMWKLRRKYSQAEECYKMAAAMVPSRLLPNYKLFQLYVDFEKKEAALRIGQLLLEQPVKKEGTKTLRMKAEVLKYIHCNNTR